MAQRGRSRSTTALPHNIQREKLPTGVWYNKSGSGCWMMDYKDIAAGKWRSKKIAGGSATLAEIWQAHAANQQDKQTALTFRALSLDFQQSIDWRDLSPLTRKDYLNCHKQIVNTKASDELFGDIEIIHWSVGTVRKYRDFRAEKSRSRANKELAYIKRLFSWAYVYEKVKFNPAKGVPKLTIDPRQHYAEDEHFAFLLQVAKDASGYWYLPYAMEIAYLCRMRLCEVLDLTEANARTEGLLIKRRKGSRDNIVAWTDHLLELWHSIIRIRDSILAKRHQPLPQSRPIFISKRTGDLIAPSTLETAKKRIDALAKAKAEELGIDYTHFTFHDLKRKGVTDTEGNKQEASGHRSAAMLNIYDVKPIIVKAAGEK
jgi:site-specific recombinase XerD